MIRYYKILELEPGASLEEVKRAYKRCVVRWHPDRFPVDDLEIQEKAHKMFRLTHEAYSKLQEFYLERSRINFADE